MDQFLASIQCAHEQGRTWLLAMDITTNRVNADKNFRERAEAVKERHPGWHVLYVHGQGVFSVDENLEVCGRVWWACCVKQ